jgi:hypothetical protein
MKHTKSLLGITGLALIGLFGCAVDGTTEANEASSSVAALETIYDTAGQPVTIPNAYGEDSSGNALNPFVGRDDYGSPIYIGNRDQYGTPVVQIDEYGTPIPPVRPGFEQLPTSQVASPYCGPSEPVIDCRRRFSQWVKNDKACYPTSTSRALSTCSNGFKCMGVNDNGKGVGTCRRTGTFLGNGRSCIAKVGCLPGLACSGLTANATGVCRPEWQQQTLSVYKGSVSTFGMGSIAEEIVVKTSLLMKDPSATSRYADFIPATENTVSAMVVTIKKPNGDKAVLCSPATTRCSNATIAAGLKPVTAFVRTINSGRSSDEVNGFWNIEASGPTVMSVAHGSMFLSTRNP